ncbi:uncharacterized protein LOC107372088 [Tetranychus urticae]|uniref:uncharacterized protein LOC107372088 n=1 Tax=Tetranychus urticae TaxID=32264 RepID=UPI00077BA780|nr:uncharacterized protein LOC107372088 [Tetranychus urticae]
MEQLEVDTILEVMKTMRSSGSGGESREVSVKERKFAEHIVGVIKRIAASSKHEWIEEEELYSVEPPENIDLNVIYDALESFDYDYIRNVIDWKERNPKINFKTLQKQFPRVTNSSYIAKFRAYLERMALNREKYTAISEFVWSRYREAQDSKYPVHDEDLKRWAFEKAREVELDGFKACDVWVENFKKRNFIGVRKTTEVITYNNEHDTAETEVLAAEFLMNFKLNSRFEPSEIFNAAQTSCAYEITIEDETSDDPIGSQKTELRTYSIQLIINMDGELCNNFMIVFQQCSDEQEDLIIPPNIYITSSDNGKVDKDALKNWATICLSPNLEREACLLISPVGTQRVQNSIFSLPDKKLTIKLLPTGSAAILQPLSVLIFKQWKLFIKKFMQRVSLDQIPLKLNDKNSIIKLNFLIHNQLRAPLFKPLIRNAWAKAGFEVEKEPDISIDSILDKPDCGCQMGDCHSASFINCAHCRHHICAFHFFSTFHHH